MLKNNQDLSGKALYDFFKKQCNSPLFLDTSYGDTEIVPLELFLKSPHQFTQLELFAIELCKGKILDVGAGSGSHSLFLQQKGKNITGLEVSKYSVQLMKERGIQNIINSDIFTYKGKQFDTLLLLMNGIGIAGSIDKLPLLLQKLKNLLSSKGQILFDSSNIDYLYEDHSFPQDYYYGEIKYRYTYEGETGKWFKWLYIHQELMEETAKKLNLNFQLIYVDENEQYLGRLTHN